MNIEVRPFDAAEHIADRETALALIQDAVESGDAGYLAKAIGVIARAHGLSDLQRETGIKRQTLNKSFSASGNPTLGTLLPVLESLNLDLRIVPAEAGHDLPVSAPSARGPRATKPTKARQLSRA